jgi:DNA-binding beta-propeller fold protein YncE
MNAASRTILYLVLPFCGGMLGVAPSAKAADFEPVVDFLKVPQGWTLGPCSAVDVSGKGEIYLFHRGPHPVICFDGEGKYLRSWGDDVIQTAHGLRIDRDDNIWVTDIGQHRVLKFDAGGKLLLSLGNGKPGTGLDQFDRPTDIAFGPRGELFVSDGYGNSRVMKFSPTGGFIKYWGKPGSGPGEFNLPHAIVLDAQGRVLVGDRENKRIQVFDQEGKLLDIWEGFAPFGLAFDKEGILFVADGYANQILRLDAAGKVQQRIGKQGKSPGEFELPHMLAVDAAGNLLVTEINGKRAQRLIRK